MVQKLDSLVTSPEVLKNLNTEKEGIAILRSLLDAFMVPTKSQKLHLYNNCIIMNNIVPLIRRKSFFLVIVSLTQGVTLMTQKLLLI